MASILSRPQCVNQTMFTRGGEVSYPPIGFLVIDGSILRVRLYDTTGRKNIMHIITVLSAAISGHDVMGDTWHKFINSVRTGGEAIEVKCNYIRKITTTMSQWGHIPGGGGYSLYDGWYICAAVLTPFFHPLGTKLDLLGVFFLIHQHKNDLLGTNPHKIRSFWPQNTIFPSIFLGPIFSGPRHTPSNFRTEYPPRGAHIM